MPSNHLILCHPLLLLPSIFTSIRFFSNESAFHIRWPKDWSFSFNIPADKDDGNGPHYYTEYWEKKRKFVVYDELLSIEPYDAPRQFCGKCIWLHGRKEGNKLLSGCGINLGYKCNGGKGFACDRFHWWNQEQRVGMTHYEYMMKQATESDKETMDIQ